MRIININSAQKLLSLSLGRRGENEVTSVVFDYTAWANEFGDGIVSLLNKRAKDSNPYPVSISFDGSKATWLVTSTDTAYNGTGSAEFVYVVGTKIAKSVVFRTSVLPDIGETGDPPDPYYDWIQSLIDAGHELSLEAEGFAVGQQDGVDVGSGSPYYHNNAKWFAENVADSIFWVTRNVTTQQQIDSAISAGKLPVLKYIDSQSSYYDQIYMPLTYYSRQFNYSYWAYTFSCDKGNGTSYSISFMSYDYGRTWIWGSLASNTAAQYQNSSNQRYVLGATNTTGERITFDVTPTNNSTRLLTSGDIYTAINKIGALLISKGLITQAEWDAR